MAGSGNTLYALVICAYTAIGSGCSQVKVICNEFKGFGRYADNFVPVYFESSTPKIDDSKKILRTDTDYEAADSKKYSNNQRDYDTANLQVMPRIDIGDKLRLVGDESDPDAEIQDSIDSKSIVVISPRSQ